VVDLERLATAYYVTLDKPDSDKEARVKEIVELKPHIPPDAARQAVHDVDAFISHVREDNLTAV